MFTYRKERTHYMQRKKGSILLYQTYAFLMVDGDGFEPSKAVPADLQSDPFGRSGTRPGAGDWSRTNNLLITNQLLCH